MNPNPESSPEGAEVSVARARHEDRASQQPVQPPASRTLRSPERQSGSRRGEYISQACLSCRKRKVKCSGEATCSECAKLGCPCVYGERKRKVRVDPAGEATSPRQQQNEDDDVAVSMIEMTAHLSTLEEQCSRLSSAITLSNLTKRRRILSRGRDSPPNNLQAAEDRRSSNGNLYEVSPLASHMAPLIPTVPWGASSSPAALGNANPAITTAPARQEDTQVPIDEERAFPPIPNPSITTPLGVEAIAQTMRHNNGAAYRHVFDMFFRSLQPLHPLINENHFQTQFNDVVFRGPEAVAVQDRESFLALVCLIRAEVSILNDPPTATVAVPGWDEFCKADGLLRNILWSGQVNIQILQCLIFKTRCLIYVNQWHQAYDTVNTAVRICLAMNLHDQARSNSGHVDSFDNIMRERVFWCLFTLDRAVALNCGMPMLLRRSECNVRLPPCIDDRSLFPEHPVPQPTHDLSCIPYLHKLIAWAEICDSIWDNLHSLTAPKPLSSNVLDSLDQRILCALEDVPNIKFAQSHVYSVLGKGALGGPTLRPMLLYRVRMNCLRLMIRKDRLTVPLPNDNTARDIVNIAKESVKILKSHTLDTLDETGHYIKATYFSSLLIPLSHVILGTSASSACWTEAASCWKQAMAGIRDIATLFNLARRILFEFHTLIKATEDAMDLSLATLLPAEGTRSDGFAMATSCEQSMGSSGRPQAYSASTDPQDEGGRQLATLMDPFQGEQVSSDMSLGQAPVLNLDSDVSGQSLLAFQDIEWPKMVTW